MAFRLEAGLAALLGVAYTVGAPDIASNLPRPMEVAFTKLHRDFNDVGRNAYYSTLQVTSQLNVPSIVPQRAASATLREAP
jgi:hypothetical protein